MRLIIDYQTIRESIIIKKVSAKRRYLGRFIDEMQNRNNSEAIFTVQKTCVFHRK